MDEPIAAGETIAHLFPKKSEADRTVGRLREAGFADVRVSERAGTTTKAHVSAKRGLTEGDFSETLTRAGFTSADAVRLTRAVAQGDTLVTVSARERLEDAQAVLRGKRVSARNMGPVDVSAPAAAAQPVPSRAKPPTTTHAGEGVIPLRAERLDVSTEKKITEARVRREVVTEQQTVTVPVQHEELVVERDGAEAVRIPISGDAPNP